MTRSEIKLDLTNNVKTIQSELALPVEVVESSSSVLTENFIKPDIRHDLTSGLFGNIDSLGPDGATGWIIDVAHPTKVFKLTATINGITIGTGITNILRQDISVFVKVPAKCGFRLEWDNLQFAKVVAELREERICPIMICQEGECRPILIPNIPIVAEVQKWLKEGLIEGHFDTVDANLFASGWAINHSNHNPVKVQILLDGIIVADAVANSPRPDFITSNPAHIMSGFKIQIPRKAFMRLECEVEARVNGEQLAGGPIRFDFSGQVTVTIPTIKNGELCIELIGWSGDILEGELYIDGRMATALNLIAMHNKAGETSNLQGRWILPEYLVDGQPHVYIFIVRHGNTMVYSDASVLSYPQYSCNIENVNLNAISGWAFRHDRLAPLRLDLFSAGKMVMQVVANKTRSDVEQSFLSAPIHVGFEFSLPHLQGENSAEFELIDAETGITIVNIAVANRYEALTSLASSLATLQTIPISIVLQAVFPKIIMQSSGEAAFSVQVLPVTKCTMRSGEVTVIIPVYGGVAETIECLESVLSAQNETQARIVIINDCTPDPLIKEYLIELDKRGRGDLVIIHRTVNGGFSQAVNIGMIVAGNTDVILLNADTVVQSRWIDRLVVAASSDSRIGTITPFSNNAEICTVPYMCKSLPVTELSLAIEVDRAAEAVNAGKIVDIPVAIGFCMYIRRECLDEIGLFDAATWGRGYGEEVDFCLKASARGWRHVMASDTFVIHRGNVSFGDEKIERIKESAKKISELYPFYDQLIQRFLAADPGAAVRRAINIELIGNTLPQKRTLHVTHGFGGGTEQYVKDMMILNREAGYTPLVLRFMDSGATQLDVDLANTRLAGFFVTEHKENYAPHETEAVKESITKLGFERLHIHAPFGVPIELMDWLTTNYPIDITIHDYAWICPRVNLTAMGGTYCGEPDVQQCTRCIELYKSHPGLRHFVEDAKGNIAQYKETFSRIIAQAETVFAGAQDVVQRMERHGMQGNYQAVPHPVIKGSVFAKSRNLANKSFDGERLKVAIFGNISDIKGFYILLDCADIAIKKKLPLYFVVFGQVMDNELCRTHSNIEVLGQYQDEELDELVQKHQPHISFFPNQWPETFSYTLSHSIRLGIWPVVSNIGAPAERVKKLKFGNVFDLNLNAENICHFLIEQALHGGRMQNEN